MIGQWIIREPEDGPYERCIISIPGRGNTAEMMIRMAENLQLPRTLIVAVRPWYSAWYPQPFSLEKQAEAVGGLPKALRTINRVVDTIRRGFDLPYEKIGLLGYSAGGVMSILAACHRMVVADHAKPAPGRSYAGVGVYCGAILEPDRIPPAPKSPRASTPFFLVHNMDDNCFDWWERYRPMKSALIRRGYQVETAEHADGGHMINGATDIFRTSRFFGHCFGLKDWEHPYEANYIAKVAERQRAEEEREQRMRQWRETGETEPSESVVVAQAEEK
jgi:predicted esterase